MDFTTLLSSLLFLNKHERGNVNIFLDKTKHALIYYLKRGGGGGRKEREKRGEGRKSRGKNREERKKTKTKNQEELKVTEWRRERRRSKRHLLFQETTMGKSINL